MPEPNPDRIRAFPTAAAFRKWLRKNHATEQELWLKIFKKASGQMTITWDEVVIEALCWGWIDGIKKSFDDLAYLQRVTPRRERSNWSKRNCEHVARLIAENRMEEPGLACVRAAKADGRWDAAYAPATEMTIPQDFLEALEERPKAKQFFEALNKTNLYFIGYQLTTAKRPETRRRRINKFITMLENGEKFR